MTGLRTALSVEIRKARSSRVLWTTGLLVAAGINLLAAATVAAARNGSADMVAKLGPRAATGDWPAFVSVGTQVTGAAAVLGFGVGISWLVGREFGDGTVSGLYGLPVGRGSMAAAKLLVFLAWAVAVAVLMILIALGAGFAVGLGTPDAATLAGLGRQLALGLLSALVAVPAGWAAAVGRGLLPGIGVSIGILVLAQVSALADAGHWIPFVAPALWAVLPTSSSAAALSLVPLVPLVFGALTVLVWRRMQIDR